MRMGLVWVALAALALTACSDGGTPLAKSRELLLQATELREGCVARSLDLLLRTLDRAAPMSEALRTDHFDSLPGGGSCDLLQAGGDEDAYGLLCYWPDGSGGAIALDLRLTYRDEAGATVSGPVDGGSLLVELDASGGSLEADGELVIRAEADRGLIVTGRIACLLDGTCLVECEIDQIVGSLVADAPVGLGVLIQTGNLDLEIDRGDGDWRYGSAALVGRTAIVAIAVNGYFSQGEISLIP